MATLEDLLIEQLRDLRDAEERILKTLPKMEKAATNEELKKGFRSHREQTQTHVDRLGKVFEELGQKPKKKSCEAIKGLLEEGEEFIKDKKMNPHVRDAGLIASAQRVEHYEMAAYGCVRTYAEQLGYTQAATLLQQTLEEERETDEHLTAIAEDAVNPAAQEGDEEKRYEL